MKKWKGCCIRYVLIVAIAFFYAVACQICYVKAAVKVSTSYEKAKSISEGSTTIIYKQSVKTWRQGVNVVKFVAPSDGNYQVKISNIVYKKPASLQMSVNYYDGVYHSITFEGGKTNDKGATDVLQAVNKKYQELPGKTRNWSKTSDWVTLEMEKGDVAWFNTISNGTDEGNIKFKITVKKTDSRKRLVQFPHTDNDAVPDTDVTDNVNVKTAGTARYGRDCLKWADETMEFTKVEAANLVYQKCPMESLEKDASYQCYDVTFKEGGVSGISLIPFAGGTYEISIWGLSTYNGKPVEQSIRFRDENFNDLSFQGLESIRDNTVDDGCVYSLCSNGYQISKRSSNVIVLKMQTDTPINISFGKNKIYTSENVDMIGYEWHVKIGIKRM